MVVVVVELACLVVYMFILRHTKTTSQTYNWFRHKVGKVFGAPQGCLPISAVYSQRFPPQAEELGKPAGAIFPELTPERENKLDKGHICASLGAAKNRSSFPASTVHTYRQTDS